MKTGGARAFVLAIALNLLISAAALARPPRFVSGPMPEYPPVASRFNVQGKVIALLSIDKKGRVTKVEIVESPADILSEAAVSALQGWQFTRKRRAQVMRVPVPFQLTEGGPAFDVAMRKLIASPATQSDVKIALEPGSAVVRIMIDRHGLVGDRLLLTASSPAFRKTVDSLVDALKFESANAGTNYERMSINEIEIKVKTDLSIELVQKSGE